MTGAVRSMMVAGIVSMAAFATDADAQGRVFSPDSAVSIHLPASFIPAPLNDDAVLQFADTASETYVMVLLESRADMVGWNLTRHSMVSAAQIVSMLDMPEVVGLRRIRSAPCDLFSMS